jgi:hypothetical protein
VVRGSVYGLPGLVPRHVLPWGFYFGYTPWEVLCHAFVRHSASVVTHFWVICNCCVFYFVHDFLIKFIISDRCEKNIISLL